MSRYVLSPLAQRDLADIRDYYLKMGSPRVARQMLVELVEAFRLARNPGIGHKREDLAENRPVLFWAVRDYPILCRPERKPIDIVTVVHGARDIPALLRRLGQ